MYLFYLCSFLRFKMYFFFFNSSCLNYSYNIYFCFLMFFFCKINNYIFNLNHYSKAQYFLENSYASFIFIHKLIIHNKNKLSIFTLRSSTMSCLSIINCCSISAKMLSSFEIVVITLTLFSLCNSIFN